MFVRFLRMHYIKYFFALIIFCTVIIYINKYEITFDNVDEFENILSDFKYNVVLLNSINKFDFNPKKIESFPSVFITNTADMLYGDDVNVDDYVKPDGKSIVNWTNGWKEITLGKCNKSTCASLVIGNILNGNYKRVYGRLRSKNRSDVHTVHGPGFIISNRIQNPKFRMFERNHAKLDNFTSVVTMEGFQENILLYSATAVTDRVELHECLGYVLDLFTPGNGTSNNWYPFSKLHTLGSVSISTNVKFTNKIDTLNRSGYTVKSMAFQHVDDKYRYDLIVSNVNFDIVSRISGMGGSVSVKLLNVHPTGPVESEQNDAVSIMQNDENTFKHDDDDSLMDMNTESEFEDKKPTVEEKLSNVDLDPPVNNVV